MSRAALLLLGLVLIGATFAVVDARPSIARDDDCSVFSSQAEAHKVWVGHDRALMIRVAIDAEPLESS